MSDSVTQTEGKEIVFKKGRVKMSDRERAILLLDTIPEYQLGYVIAYLQGMHDSLSSPNQETKEAIEELKNGGGHKFSGTTDDLFAELGA